ncbi:hypothetical protein PACTADRAFT_51549 [Pachysolen tannophilus NRRL Y-2460]|uniref:hydroxyacylglutathione hydrolase n=1 Tax=Pachysolen tannophilus NRRL Y-2460 TaxID=669874 RepID=A0A1E4TPX6_PACTA|nr:hypothetical protein PACTADRAFT_51549 [Pachysolen tannophilus NRRL Y-2460]
MHVRFIPMRWGSGDNYCYVITDSQSKDSWIIDPAEPDDIVPTLEKLSNDISLKAIVNTHHHWDHSNGNKFFSIKYKGLPIIAGKDSPLVTYTPSHNEVIQLGTNIEIKALHTPCHTQDSICYYAIDKQTNEKCVFTGDTLFTSGCGRFFEGTAKEMNKCLNDILSSLPDDTVVYPGHEYTASNCNFSLKVMPRNKELQELAKFANKHEFATGHFTIKDEKLFNPFFRLNKDKEVVDFCKGLADPIQIMDFLRTAKNNS